MPPPFPLYLLISSVFATGFFVLLGAILTALVRWNAGDVFSPAALLFYAAFLFTGVLRILKDAWAYWPYAFHSGKFLRRNPTEGYGSRRSWLQLSPGLSGAAIAIAIVGTVTSLVYVLTYGITGVERSMLAAWIPAPGTVGRELLFWLPGVIIIPLLLFSVMFVFGIVFVRSYAKFSGASREISASRALVGNWLMPEALAFLTLNAAILWPVGTSATSFALDAGFSLALLGAGAGLVAFSTAALWLNIASPATPALTGAVFSRLWRLQGIDRLSVPAPLPEAGVPSFRFRDYFLPVFLLNFGVFVGWRLLLTAAPGTFASFAWFLIPAECIWLVAFARFRMRFLREDLVRVHEYYRARPYFYGSGPAHEPAGLPAELAA